MKALLFILAVSMGLVALAARRHLNRTLDPDDDDTPQFAESIKTSNVAAKNLNDAISRISNASNKPQNNPSVAAPSTTKAADAEVNAEVERCLKIMQSDPDQAYSAL